MRNALYIFLISFSGCVSVAPDLKIPEQCNHLSMPKVPQKMTLIIDGSRIESDKDGQEFLRYYVRARQLLR